MQLANIRKLKTLGVICFFACIAGIIYQLIAEQRVDYNSVVIGLSLGLVFGLLELILFPTTNKQIRGWPFTKLLIFKAFLYTFVIYIITASLTIVYFSGKGLEISEYLALIIAPSQLILVIYSLVVYSFFVLMLQINQLLGEGVLWKFIRGKYHKPREEERIFMFLDMRSSTMVAEKIGHKRFYTLLNELFHEISQPVLQTKAEIYQYVGDEVVLTWEIEDGLENFNCLKVFFLFQENLRRNSESYLNNFGVRPEFKAGLHFGKVISAQIGDLKREIVYNGDVLNTTARIQGECNKYKQDLLVSGALMKRLGQVNGFLWEKIDTVILRGKEIEVELFSAVILAEKINN
jgi:adenylate cyclase